MFAIFHYTFLLVRIYEEDTSTPVHKLKLLWMQNWLKNNGSFFQISGNKSQQWKLVLEHRSIGYNWLHQLRHHTDSNKKDGFMSYIKQLSKDKITFLIQGGSKGEVEIEKKNISWFQKVLASSTGLDYLYCINWNSFNI